MSFSSRIGFVAVLGSLIVSPIFAQIPNPYGAAIDNESARKVAAAAIAEARKNGWNMAVAIVDTAGELVYFEKLDGTQAASVNIAIDKARSSARFKRPTKALQDVLATGGAGLRMLALDGAVPVEGGVPHPDGRKTGGRHRRVGRDKPAGRPGRDKCRRRRQVTSQSQRCS